jgi:hypothetical protein
MYIQQSYTSTLFIIPIKSPHIMTFWNTYSFTNTCTSHVWFVYNTIFCHTNPTHICTHMATPPPPGGFRKCVLYKLWSLKIFSGGRIFTVNFKYFSQKVREGVIYTTSMIPTPGTYSSKIVLTIETTDSLFLWRTKRRRNRFFLMNSDQTPQRNRRCTCQKFSSTSHYPWPRQQVPPTRHSNKVHP